jgi:uncharacterized protein YrrD
MIVKVSELKKADILTLEGQKTSSVQDILYDPKQKTVIAFITARQSLVSDAKVIPLTEVQKIGQKAVLIKSLQSEKKISELGEPYTSLIKDESLTLTKGKLVGENAVEYGTVSDTFFDSQTGRIVEFEYSEGTIESLKSGKKTIRIKEILSVGKDAVIVKSTSAQTQPEPKAQPNQSQTQDPNPQIIKEAIGKYASKNILTPQDQLFAAQNQIITNEMLQEAYTIGLLDQILQNSSIKPVV